ncbi:kinase-like protein, partial [Rhodotorula sp. JG-1b]
PSLATIEKAAAARIFFETKYHALLRQPQSRERSRAVFERALASLNLPDSERRRIRAAWLESQSRYLRELRYRLGPSSFVKLKTIGHGAFGVVSLVRERGEGQLYAMKQMRKADMLRKGQEGHLRAERDLLASAASTTRWIVKLAYSFQDVDHLYLVMSYMPGGDLLTLLIERDTFPEKMARFYAAEMVLAIQETHQTLGAMHRDIKPDNWLFDAKGHLAISDFGLATDLRFDHEGRYFHQQRQELLHEHASQPNFGSTGSEASPSILTWRDQQRRKKAFSVVGTNNYMAPEVLRGAGYDVRADWWSLGIIVYEMLYGYPPFVSKNRQDTRHKIMNWSRYLRFPSSPEVSREAQDFIASLLCDAAERLGTPLPPNKPTSAILGRRGPLLVQAGPSTEPTSMAEDGSEEIKRHAWFRGIEWSSLHLQTPPFQPKLAHETDTRYFDDDIPAEPLPAPEIAPGVPAPVTAHDALLRHPVEGPHLLEVRKQYAFKGWTFKKPSDPVYDPRNGWRGDIFGGAEPSRGRPNERVSGPGSSFIRSLSV